jgi:hypothetical protein
MGLEVDQDDVEVLVKSRNRDLTTEVMQELNSFIDHDNWGGGTKRYDASQVSFERSQNWSRHHPATLKIPVPARALIPQRL